MNSEKDKTSLNKNETVLQQLSYIYFSLPKWIYLSNMLACS